MLAIFFQNFAAERVTLSDIENDPKLTPQRFARYFSDFEYQYGERILEPEEFLAARKGDCDDYATLAFALLNSKGFHAHLVIVRMPGLNHVVCYVDEIKGYLDYNLRGYSKRTSSCKRSLRKIADDVADTFAASWSSASEFSFQDGVKYLVSTITRANPSAITRINLQNLPPGLAPDFVPLEP